jgi:2-methylcitrate dehydratase PrpD
MNLAAELAERAVALDYDRFDTQAIKWARDAITDMIGCALLGAPTGTTRMAMASGMNNAGPALVLGRPNRLAILDAAFVNGASGHALDYDDTSKSLSGHPTVVIVPGLLALAESRKSSGRDLVDAYIVGVELATRFARGVNFYHYEKGWHPTATLGIFGAAAAACRLLRLPAAQTANALAMAASLASGVKANFGTITKPMHAGFAARNGLFAALMAEQNVPASPVAFEHPQGFLEVFNGADNYTIEKMLKGWGQPLDLLEPGISIKKYPCVYSTHGAIDAAIHIKQTESPDPAGIEKVVVRMHRRRMLPHVLNPATTALNAKFSLPYAVSRGLVTGAVTLDHFEDSALHDKSVLRVMSLIEMDPHQDDSNDYGAEVIVTMSDGRQLKSAVAAPLGRGPETPLPADMLRSKFIDCATRSLDEKRAGDVFDMLMELDGLPRVNVLTAAIEAATTRPSA